MAHFDPAARLGLCDLERDAVFRLEYQSGLLARRLSHIGERNRDDDCSSVREPLFLHPGEIARLIAHLHPGIEGDHDFDRVVTARDEQFLGAGRWTVVHRGAVFRYRAKLPGRYGQRDGKEDERSTSSHQWATSILGPSGFAEAAARC